MQTSEQNEESILERGSPADVQDRDKAMGSGHMIMMALSGSLGIGLLIGTGAALTDGGPGSMICGYAIVGMLVYMVMCSVGEVCSYIPMSQGFAGYASRYVDPCLGFAVGWIYYLNYLVVTPHQITAGAMVLQYWIDRESINPGVFIAIFYVLSFLINYVGGIRFVKHFEYWISAVKVGVMAVVLLALLVMSLGGNPDKTMIGFRYWKDPGAFKEYDKNGYEIEGGLGRLVAFCTIGVTAVFSYLGVELVGVTVGEASDPRRAIPKAVKLTFRRTVGFFCLASILIGMCVPYNDESLVFSGHGKRRVDPHHPRFLVAFSNLNLPIIAHIVNGFFVVFIFAAAVAALYIGPKTLHGLAEQGKAWKFLTKINKRGVPSNALFFTTPLCLTCFLNCSSSSARVFEYFVSFSALLGLLTWMTILITHICFMRALAAQGVDRDTLSYKAPWQPYGSWISLVFCAVLALSKNFPVFLRPAGVAFDWVSFVVGYIALPMFIALCAGYKAWTKTVAVNPHTADLTTGKQEVDDSEQDWSSFYEKDKLTNPQSKWSRVGSTVKGILF